MRQFSSYGLIDKDLNYYVSRAELLAKAYTYLVGEIPEKGGHYFTVWAPRQTGKSSLLRDIYWTLLRDDNYHVANIDIQNLQSINKPTDCMNTIIEYINDQTGLELPQVESTIGFQKVFSNAYLAKPLILIIDEFDSLQENVIHDIVSVFQNIYSSRQKDIAPSSLKKYLLHGVALIGVRSVVGVENQSGSPFNVQRSLQVHNLTAEEVNEMCHWYAKESGQEVEQEVIDEIYYVTQGQPGLVSWFGELLTQRYNDYLDKPLTMEKWRVVYGKALHLIHNNTIMNIISKATADEYRSTVLNLFRIDQKEIFEFEDPAINYLFMHGVISYEDAGEISYIKFPCPFVQEKLYRHFSKTLGQLYGDLLVDSFQDLTPIINAEGINITRLLELYQEYYTLNRERLIEYAQRRVDLQIMEVVYPFQFYSWLDSFLIRKKGRVIPEFPTGNGKIDLLIHYAGYRYGLELKSFSDLTDLKSSIQQASDYGKSLGLNTITLVVFIDKPIPCELKSKYAKTFSFHDSASVDVFFIVTA